MSVITTSGFFAGSVSGSLRVSMVVSQWDITKPDPQENRMWESGQYRPSAKISNIDGFNAQKESGVALDFGENFVNDAGFYSNTVCLTMNPGEVNSHPDSFFDMAENIGTTFKAFNVNLWVHNVDTFDPSGFIPVFYFLTSKGWRKNLKLRPSTAGAAILPSSMPARQNIPTRAANEVFMSGNYNPGSFSHYVYLVGEFPPANYSLGTYGGLGVDNFSFRASYSWSSIDANILQSDLDV